MELWLMKVIALIVLVISIAITGLVSYYAFKKKPGCLEDGSIRGGLNCALAGIFLALVFIHIVPSSRVLLEDASKAINYKLPLPETFMVGSFLLVIFFEYAFESLKDCGKTKDESSTEPLKDKEEKEDYGTIKEKPNEKSSSEPRHPLAALLLVTSAFSTHSFFEGLALGLQLSHMQLWTFFIAIVSHKCVMVVALVYQGMQVEQPAKKALICLAIFAVSTAGGIGLGIVVQEVVSREPRFLVLNGALQCVSAGFILYVGLLSMMARELVCEQGDLTKATCLIVGFVCMGALRLIHSHEMPEQETMQHH